jgi:cytidine deaminase
MRENTGREFHGLASTHAEVNAYYAYAQQFRKHGKIKYIDYYVIRMSTTGNISNARPCKHCILFMRKLGVKIRRVYYTCGEGLVRQVAFADLIEEDFEPSHGTTRKQLRD